MLLMMFGLLSGHLLRNNWPHVWPYVLMAFCLFVYLFISRFGFKIGIWPLIAPVPKHCFSITLITSVSGLCKHFIFTQRFL